jgi:large subunit ribosomal protein L6
MSRIGKKPVPLTKGVTASVSGQTVEVKGPKGTRSFTATDDVTITVDGAEVKVAPRGLSKRARQQWGMTRSMIENLVTGVTTGFKKEMEIQGVGYRAAVAGQHPETVARLLSRSEFRSAEGRDRHDPEADRNRRGRHRRTAGRPSGSEHPRMASPEPYKGKGIRYKGEFVFRKEGKKK